MQSLAELVRLLVLYTILHFGMHLALQHTGCRKALFNREPLHSRSFHTVADMWTNAASVKRCALPT